MVLARFTYNEICHKYFIIIFGFYLLLLFISFFSNLSRKQWKLRCYDSHFSDSFLAVISCSGHTMFSLFLKHFLIKRPHTLDNNVFDTCCIPLKYDVLVYIFYCGLDYALGPYLATRLLVNFGSKSIVLNIRWG